MSALLTVLAVIAGAIGVFSLSQATTGVGVIALGCLFGILARLAQAESHQRALLQAKA